MIYTIDTPINKFRSDISAADLKRSIIKSKPDSPLATESICQAIITHCQNNDLDQVYLTAHAILESAWGTSRYAVQRNNLFGYGAYTTNPDNAYTFTSKEECIKFIAAFVKKAYLSETGKWYGGAPTLRGMNVRYATSTTWATSIAKIANQLSGTASASLEPGDIKLVVSASKGVNIRTSPTTQGKNIARVGRSGETLFSDKQVVGERVSSSNLWYKLKDELLYVWSGGVSEVESLAQDEEIDSKNLSGWDLYALPRHAPLEINQLSTAIAQLDPSNSYIVAIKQNAILK